MGRQSGSAADPLAAYRSKRDFQRTEEPLSSRRSTPSSSIFVVQKHHATRLHFDFRLELDGVLRSWAIPKGPSVDTSVRRLAVEVEDHPISYAGFEGIIPQGEYGGGTVMLWDMGTYRYVGANPDAGSGMRDALRDGKLQFQLEGVRLQGIWTLVRTDTTEHARQWLLIHHGDRGASRGAEPVDYFTTSVATGRSFEQIAADG